MFFINKSILTYLFDVNVNILYLIYLNFIINKNVNIKTNYQCKIYI